MQIPPLRYGMTNKEAGTRPNVLATKYESKSNGNRRFLRFATE